MSNQLVVGMPSSGKSTYIGALRHMLVADEVSTALVLTSLAADEAHLDRIEEEWLTCSVDRTKTGTEGWVELRVRDRGAGTEVILSIPDLRGEVFEQPATGGQCRRDLHDGLIDSDGLMVFTNADREDDNLMIDEFGDLFSEDAEPFQISDASDPADGRLDADAPGRREPDEGATSARGSPSGTVDIAGPRPFRPEDMPEEVKLVEFLQLANRDPRYRRRRRIAVIVSAWDVVDATVDTTPDGWLAEKRPMLAQFLETNEDLWDTRVYGISAQGGSLPRDKAKLEAIARPSERVSVVGHGAAAHDLTAPLRWLMG